MGTWTWGLEKRLLIGLQRRVHAHFGFGPLCAYLSINYLD
ncbi:hypothetical protein OIU79_015625, partial [Salix purpurea]